MNPGATVLSVDGSVLKHLYFPAMAHNTGVPRITDATKGTVYVDGFRTP